MSQFQHAQTPSGSLLHRYIPYGPPLEPQPGRMLVLCFDGTGDQFDNNNSNVVQLVSMLKKDDKAKQMVYYQPGIGTYTSSNFVIPLMAKLSEILDEMFAWNLKDHVIGGYEFLMQNYRPGDKICIFGFSRGAYTARSLAGMIDKVGIIPADNHQQVPFAYKSYTRADRNQLSTFKSTFSVDVNIEFVGVWDTVDSIGFIPKYLPLTRGNPAVKTFRHAVSLDEHRSKFNVNLWIRHQLLEIEKNPPAFVSKLQGLHVIHEDGGDDKDEPIPNGDTTLYRLRSRDGRAQGHLEVAASDRNTGPTDVEEVWFAGCHCDIGGGSVMNGTRYSLARIPLRWMVRECFKAKTGILFDTASLYTIGLDPATLYPDVLERPSLSDSLIARASETPTQTPESTSWSQRFRSKREQNVGSHQIVPFISEDDEDLGDALSSKYDQLKINRLWWILEIFPVKKRHQHEKREREKREREKREREKREHEQREHDILVSRIGPNWGDARIIPGQHIRGIKVHRSVKLRMEARFDDGKKYQPKANLNLEGPKVDLV